MSDPFIELPVSTRCGQFLARYSEKGLAELDFPSRKAGLAPDCAPGQCVPVGTPDKINRWHRLTESALRAVLAGTTPDRLPPLDPAGTYFQKSVWNALRKIPAGETRSYGEIAIQIGKPRAVRAVGGACGANPIPVLVPCHRVLAANRKIGGFSGGLNWKRALLSAEGINF